jgi:uncharacterized Zn finger protein
MEKTEIIEAKCPSCSPEEPKMHVLLKKHDGRVRCEECGHVHKIPVKKEKQLKIRVVISRQDKSSVQEMEAGSEDIIHADDEFVVDTGEEVSGVRVQSIELKDGKRVKKAKAPDIMTIWARAIDEVIVKIAVQKKEITESFDYKVNGDYEFIIGSTMKIGGYEVAITNIKVREGGIFRREGTAIKAKDIKRVYSKIIGESKFGSRRKVGSGSRSIPGVRRSTGSKGKTS